MRILGRPTKTKRPPGKHKNSGKFLFLGGALDKPNPPFTITFVGLPRLWEALGLGEGYSSLTIAGGRVYVTGSIDGDCLITALDMNGNALLLSC